MKYLHQLLILGLFSFLGEVCHLLIPAPIPASIYGMILLFLALALKLLPLRLVEDTGKFLVGLLPVLLVVSTGLIFAVSGLVTQWLLKDKEEAHD